MKVLVVDDHRYNRELLGFILEDYEHDAVHAENGEEACNIVASDESIDLVLMDVMMPVMDGIEATRKIKSSIDERFLPILFVTALDDEKNITACLEAGGDDFVPKPVSENILVAKLNAHVRSKTIYDNLKNAHEELTYHRSMVDREHNIIEHMFKNGSGRVDTTCDNIESYTSPMSMFNGDLVLVAPSPSGGVYGLVGDFTGHGLAASIGTLPVTEVFFHNIHSQSSISQIAQQINLRLSMLLPNHMFFCAAIFEIDRWGDSMTLWMGGMNDIYALVENTSDIETIESEHMPLGILNEAEFDDSPCVISLEKYDQLFIYTDGIPEAHNKHQEEFGDERFTNILKSRPNNPIQAVVEEVSEFTCGREQSDDVSIIEIKPGKVVHRSKESGKVVDIGETSHLIDSIPWRLSMVLSDDDLKSTNVVNQIMSFVSSIKGIELHQDKIFTIVSELYNNSLEHGVLRLDSSIKHDADGFERYYNLRQERLDNISNQTISIEFNYFKGEQKCLELVIEDSGDGFDCSAINCSTERGELAHGRGITLLNELCASLKYESQGKKVRAVYELRQH